MNWELRYFFRMLIKKNNKPSGGGVGKKLQRHNHVFERNSR